MKKVFVGFFLIVIAVIGFFRLNPGNIFTPWLIKISRGPRTTALSTKKGNKHIPYSTFFVVKSPQPVTARQVSALMTVKAGGTLTLTDAKGMVATLYIPSGALKQDTTITMAPLQEVPIAEFTGALSNGVVIEPEGLRFAKNAQLTFDFTSKKSLSVATSPIRLASNEDNAALLERLKSHPEEIENFMKTQLDGATQEMQKLGVSVKSLDGGVPVVKLPAMTSAMNGTKAVKNTLPKLSTVIHVDHQTGRVNIAETTRSIYGSKITAVVTSLSSFPVVDLGGSMGKGLGQNDLQNGAADAGGACTPGFISAMLRIASWQQGSGEPGGDATAMQAVEDCGKAALEEMKQRCEADPIHVTRREMFGLNQMLQQLGLEPEAEQAKELMQSCKRIYSVSADVDVAVPEGKSTYGISAQLCGYLDEQWVGTEIIDYKLDLDDGAWVQHVLTGDIRFTLPHGGGQFQMATRGTLIASTFVPRVAQIPDTIVSEDGEWQIGEYDGDKQMTIFYTMYGHADVPLPIQVTKEQCESTNEVLDQAGF